MKLTKNKVYNKVLILPDIHLPWANWPAIMAAHRWYLKHKPDLVIQLGDITDQKIWSRWPKDVDDWSPSEEFMQAEKAMRKLQKLFPKMIILRGNHDTRITQRAVEAGVPAQMFRDLDQVFAFPGWTWIKSGERLVVKTQRGPVLFMHGDEMGGTVAQKSRILGMSVITGHTHKASITYTAGLQGHFFGAEMGALLDTKSKAAKYAAPNPLGCSIGFGVLKYGVPYFIDFRSKMKL